MLLEVDLLGVLLLCAGNFYRNRYKKRVFMSYKNIITNVVSNKLKSPIVEVLKEIKM